MTALAIRRDTPEWLEARREYITSTDVPVILGLSPYKVEADLAVEKMGEPDADDPATARRKRLGKLLEAIVREEDQVEHGIKVRAVNRFIVSRTIPWAATSLDFERVGERVIVEAKTSRSAKRFTEGELPQDVEAQVRWQMGVAGYPLAHVAVLRYGSELECFDVEHDEPTFQGLVEIAADFRDRLAAGGPFAQSKESVKRRFPTDNGAEMVADDELEARVAGLIALREQRKKLEAEEEAFESAIKGRMGEFAVLRGKGFSVTWKRTKDTTTVDWKSAADGLLRQMPETEREAFVGLHTTVRPGFRPFRVVLDKEA